MLTRGRRDLWSVLVAAVFLMVAGMACGPTADEDVPTIVITSPSDGATVMVGEVVQIGSMAAAKAGVVRVELFVNGRMERNDEPLDRDPTTFSIVQPWTPAEEGEARISAVAYDAEGAASRPATIALRVVAGVAGAEATPTPTMPPTPTASPAPTEEATPTPTEEPTGGAGCMLDASYVADVTVPDGTVFLPGTPFIKTWRVRNSGTCDWGAGFSLVFVGGDQMGGPGSVPVPALGVGNTADVSVNLVAPFGQGSHQGKWRVQSDGGVALGSTLTVQIVVADPTAVPTEEPTAPPTQEPTEEPTQEPTPVPTEAPTEAPTPEPDPPDLVITDVGIDTNDPRVGVPLRVIVRLRNQGGSTAENFYWAWRPCTIKHCGDFVEAPGPFTLEPGEQVVAQLEYTFSGGAHGVTTVWVDSRERVEEGEESNNTRGLNISVSSALIERTLHRDPDRSGSMNPRGAGSPMYCGIRPNGDPMRTFLDFDLAELPGLDQESVVKSVTLDLSNYSGNCIGTIGPLVIQRVEYGNTLDYPDDFNSHVYHTVHIDRVTDLNSPILMEDLVRTIVEIRSNKAHVQLRLQLAQDNAGSGSACMMELLNPVLTVTYEP